MRSGDISIFWNRGTGKFEGPRVFGGDTWGIIPVDLDDDGDRDLLTITHDTNASPVLTGLSNRGDGTFAEPFPVEVSSLRLQVGEVMRLRTGWGLQSEVIISDFNGDQVPAIASLLFVVNGPLSISIAYGSGALILSPTAQYFRHVTAGDFDGDGDLDLATDGISIFINDGGVKDHAF